MMILFPLCLKMMQVVKDNLPSDFLIDIRAVRNVALSIKNLRIYGNILYGQFFVRRKYHNRRLNSSYATENRKEIV